MNRIKKSNFQDKKDRFVPYIMSGDPSYDAAIDIALELQNAGVDALEWGVPFSDPLADGPVIQAAGDRSRNAGGSLTSALKGIKEARTRGLELPVVLFTYVNPVLSYGIENVVSAMREADIDGILIPDLPFEESEELRELCGKEDISVISLIAPSSKHRMEKISRLGDGFLYYVTSLGVTGTRQSFSDDLAASIETLKTTATVPVLAGFGISTREHVQHFQSIADGVIVGSALVKFIGERNLLLQEEETKQKALEEIKEFVQELIS
ncbi:tryptophan synthase subunit alpha [Salipaludibacillus neizhouensis]|uniref:Tryptophan synthase alpha chain n=1 Tax=Salipaludibacillus neizhouensis TaxID=885475 RepID=A0A3A9KAT6_9BACI|nr:tryptophan synthase subunit alpha [Salipaludibacillus neizhouensis]RKL67581.1 tryptophan synthase subunit alpha [Salipaludibacillus neizhouensis]